MNQFPDSIPETDAEGISVDDIYERAYTRALYCLGSQVEAHRIAQEVCTVLWKKWAREEERRTEEMLNPVSDRPSKHRSRAYFIDITTHAEIKTTRDRLMKSARQGLGVLDRETLIVWFMEELNTFILNHDSSYAAVGMLMILCAFDYEDVEELFVYLNPDSSLSDASFRQNKKRMFTWLLREFRGFLKQEKQRHKEPSRFVSEPASDHLRSIAYLWQGELTPLRPRCFLCQTVTFDVYTEDLSAIFRERVSSWLGQASPMERLDAIERERIQIMICPKCLTRYLTSLNRIDWKEKLVLPGIHLPADGKPPIDRRSIPRLSENDKKLIEKMILGKEDLDSGIATASYLSIAVDGEQRRIINVSKPRRDHFHLKDGENVIKVSYLSDGISIPIDVHIVPWDKEFVTNTPLQFITDLSDGRQLQFSVTYRKHGGELREAIVDVDYTRPVMRTRTSEIISRIRNRFAPLPSTEKGEDSQDWSLAARVIAACSLILFGGGYLAWQLASKASLSDPKSPNSSFESPQPKECRSDELNGLTKAQTITASRAYDKKQTGRAVQIGLVKQTRKVISQLSARKRGVTMEAVSRMRIVTSQPSPDRTQRPRGSEQEGAQATINWTKNLKRGFVTPASYLAKIPMKGTKATRDLFDSLLH